MANQKKRNHLGPKAGGVRPISIGKWRGSHEQPEPTEPGQFSKSYKCMNSMYTECTVCNMHMFVEIVKLATWLYVLCKRGETGWDFEMSTSSTFIARTLMINKSNYT